MYYCYTGSYNNYIPIYYCYTATQLNESVLFINDNHRRSVVEAVLLYSYLHMVESRLSVVATFIQYLNKVFAVQLAGQLSVATLHKDVMMYAKLIIGLPHNAMCSPTSIVCSSFDPGDPLIRWVYISDFPIHTYDFANIKYIIFNRAVIMFIL